LKINFVECRFDEKSEIMNNDEKQVHVINEDYNAIPYQNLELALKVNFQ